jgi:hypothetical protein
MSRFSKFFHQLDDALQAMAWVPRLMLIVAMVLIVWQATDREPPFHVVSVEPAHAHPGEVVVITARVKRDTTRNCSATMSRSIYDSTGARADYPVTRFSDSMIDMMEKETPGMLRVALLVPMQATSGPARLVSVLDYRCNRVHSLWPIEVTTIMPFEVLP